MYMLFQNNSVLLFRRTLLFNIILCLRFSVCDYILEYLHQLSLIYQVKATAENVDEAVRELPDANLVRYSFWVSIWVWFINSRCFLFSFSDKNL